MTGWTERGVARIGGMDRQTLREWVHRFNADGPEGLFDHWTSGPAPPPRPEQFAEVARIVEAGPDRTLDGVVRWRRADLKRVIAERFGDGQLALDVAVAQIARRVDGRALSEAR